MTQNKQTIIEKETTVQIDTTPDAIKVAVMDTHIKHLNDTMVRIEGKFDTAISTFVTQDKLADAQLRADEKHKEQDLAIKKLEDWNLWATRIVLGAVLLAGMGVVLVKMPH